MKIQQIERSRTGRQGMDAGFRITGSSPGITDAIRQDFSGLYTTLSIQQYPAEMPYVLDFGGGRIREYIYFTHILSSIDACGRRSPYIHSYVIKRRDFERCCKTAEERITLLRYLNDRINWKSCAGRLQAKSSKVILPEIELQSETELECGLERHLQEGAECSLKRHLQGEAECGLKRHLPRGIECDLEIHLPGKTECDLKRHLPRGIECGFERHLQGELECGLKSKLETELLSKSKHEIDYIEEIQKRYGMTEDAMKGLFSEVRKTLKTPGLSMNIPMNFATGNAVDQLLDFMYMVYSCIPSESWNDISFCSYHLKGMRRRNFSM